MSEPRNTQGIRQVHLPNGKMIEVLYFDSTPPAIHPAVELTESRTGDAAATAAAAPASDAHRGLHICLQCSSTLVQPVDWSEAGPRHWEVLLHCPECEWSELGTFTQQQIDRFDSELDTGAEALLTDLQHLTHANMSEEVDRFVEALQRDHIIPADF